MKCPNIDGCSGEFTPKAEPQRDFQWVYFTRKIPLKAGGYTLLPHRVFPKLWAPKMEHFYCGSHGHFVRFDEDGEWYWYSYFRPTIFFPQKSRMLEVCPKKCFHEHKTVGIDRFGQRHCTECLWDGARVVR